MFTSLSAAINQLVSQEPENLEKPVAYNKDTNELYSTNTSNNDTKLLSRMIILISQHVAIRHSVFNYFSVDFKNCFVAGTRTLENRTVEPILDSTGERLFKFKVATLPDFNSSTDVTSIPSDYIPDAITAKDIQLLLTETFKPTDFGEHSYSKRV